MTRTTPLRCKAPLRANGKPVKRIADASRPSEQASWPRFQDARRLQGAALRADIVGREVRPPRDGGSVSRQLGRVRQASEGRVEFALAGNTTRPELREIRRNAKNASLKDPYRAFMAHKKQAEDKGIGFLLDVLGVVEFLANDYRHRDGCENDLCTGRIGDTGSYAVGNVYLTTNKENSKDYASFDKKKDDLARLKSSREERLLRMREMEQLPPPQYSYEQMVAMLRLGIPFELRPKMEVGHAP